MNYLTIKILPEDIEGADVMSSTQCPVARSLRRSYNPKTVTVYPSIIWMKNDGVLESYLPSKRASLYIADVTLGLIEPEPTTHRIYKDTTWPQKD